MTQHLNSKSKKICLMGASGVGKTSLVKRFVEGKFDDTYRTTIGVHIDSKSVICDEEQVKLIIWDLEGKDDLRSEYPATYLDGAQGYMLVADVTRPDTLDVAKGLLSTIMRHRNEENEPPFVLLLNKQDLVHVSSVTKQAKINFGNDISLFKTSTKLDEGVQQAFNCLVRQMLEVDRGEGPNQQAPSNDLEQTSPGEYTKTTEPTTLSFDERALFDDLFSALDCLVLERSIEGHIFWPIYTMPDWAQCLITMNPDQSGQNLWIAKSHFLKFYIEEANSWWEQHEGGAFASVPWEEVGLSDTYFDFEATATAIGPRKFLVIKRGAPSRRAYIQLVRGKRLNLPHRSLEL